MYRAASRRGGRAMPCAWQSPFLPLGAVKTTAARKDCDERQQNLPALKEPATYCGSRLKPFRLLRSTWRPALAGLREVRLKADTTEESKALLPALKGPAHGVLGGPERGRPTWASTSSRRAAMAMRTRRARRRRP